jgi:flagellar protein FliT
MNDGKIILGEYEQIASLTRRMLEAARRSEWVALIELERNCGQHFARLLDGSIVQPDDDSYRSRKAALIRGILDDDAEIRLLVEPWLAQLSQLIGNTRQQSRLHQAYRPGL